MSRLIAILPAVIVSAFNSLPQPVPARLCAMLMPGPGDGVVTRDDLLNATMGADGL